MNGEIALVEADALWKTILIQGATSHTGWRLRHFRYILVWYLTLSCALQAR